MSVLKSMGRSDYRHEGFLERQGGRKKTVEEDLEDHTCTEDAYMTSRTGPSHRCNVDVMHARRNDFVVARLSVLPPEARTVIHYWRAFQLDPTDPQRPRRHRCRGPAKAIYQPHPR